MPADRDSWFKNDTCIASSRPKLVKQNLKDSIHLSQRSLGFLFAGHNAQPNEFETTLWFGIAMLQCEPLPSAAK